MPKTTSEEKYRWIKPILNKEITIKNMAKVCPFSERSLKYWLSRFRENGIKGLDNKSRRPKTNLKETSIRIKEKIIELRKQNKCCAKKLCWQLKKEGVNIHYQTIQKIIKREGLTRKYRTRKIKYKYVKTPLRIGELVEIDVKYVPQTIGSKKLYQFTAIDCASRWRYLKVYDDISNNSAIKFLRKVLKIAPFKIHAVKTDNGSYFTNRYTGYLKSSDPLNPKLHAFDVLCAKLGIQHYLIDPGKPAQNGKVERSHRTDQESFYDQLKFKSFEELQYKLKLWNMYYNDLEHCGLNGKTPNQVLRLGVQYVCI
jgi:transposase InsO family protein